MAANEVTTAGRYLEHLTERDVAFLARPCREPDEVRQMLRSEAGAERLLCGEDVFERLFGPAGRSDPFMVASPFLIFAVAVHAAARELERATFVSEWVGPRRRLPVFDVGSLLAFLADPARRLFLVELLASYTKVASGSVWVPGRRGWRRQRFSELDPVRLASLLDVLPEEERPGILRRLGDLALFLTGVFPDRAAAWPLSELQAARLLRSGAMAGRTAAAGGGAGPSEGAGDGWTMFGLLERLGERWYRLASERASPRTAEMRVVGDVAGQFAQGRRILNVVTDRYLFPFRPRWFPGG